MKTIAKALDHICNFVWVRMMSEFMLESIHINRSKLRNWLLKDKQLENTTNNRNLADPAADKVKQKENAALTLKSYHENQREQKQNYLQLNWLQVA